MKMLDLVSEKHLAKGTRHARMFVRVSIELFPDWGHRIGLELSFEKDWAVV
jgi:hypothetical protein